MSRRYWLPILAVVGLAIVAASQAQPVKQGSSPASGGQAAQQQVAQSPKPETPSTTDKLIERAAKALETANRHPNAAQEAQDSKTNLDIQRDMAVSAQKMTIIGAIEAFITIIGVILVGWTLYHTRRAANATADAVKEANAANAIARDANRLAFQGQRAWLGFVTFGYSRQLNDDGSVRGLIVTAVFANTGQTPALNCDIFVGQFSSPPEVAPETQDYFAQAEGPSSSTMFVFPTVKTESGPITIPLERLRWGITGERRLFVAVRVRYQDIAFPDQHITQLVCEMRPENPHSLDALSVPNGEKPYVIATSPIAVHTRAT